jgi:hypothetical protein
MGARSSWVDETTAEEISMNHTSSALEGLLSWFCYAFGNSEYHRIMSNAWDVSWGTVPEDGVSLNWRPVMLFASFGLHMISVLKGVCHSAEL